MTFFITAIANQIDYIYFVSGCLQIILTILCFQMTIFRDEENEKGKFKLYNSHERSLFVNFGYFALLNGSIHWPNLIGISYFDSEAFKIGRYVITLISFIPLIDLFASKMTKKQKQIGNRITAKFPIPFWEYLLIIFFVFCGISILFLHKEYKIILITSLVFYFFIIVTLVSILARATIENKNNSYLKRKKYLNIFSFL
ncbi:MAG: hypothetical protein HQK51_18405 [Oligoflexia bacterium]|nr:hypothetical protein [Oligoflexia bacterium]